MVISAGRIIAIVAGIVGASAAMRPAGATPYAETTSISGSTLSGPQTFAATSGSAGIIGNATLSGNVTFNLGFYVNSLAVGGGGGGDDNEVGNGAGGGGGGVTQAGFFVSGGRVTALVGNGGLGGNSTRTTGAGENSSVKTGAAGEFTIATGTGGGGAIRSSGVGGTSGNGYSGGNKSGAGAPNGGGGGGAGGAGGAGQSPPSTGGNGGAGLVVTTFQTAASGTVFGGGGGGTGYWFITDQYNGGAGGSGGGGAGYSGSRVSPGPGANGTNGLGGGGGGGMTIGGTGGSGFVALSYLGSQIGTVVNGTQAAGINAAAGYVVVSYTTTTGTGSFELTEAQLQSRLSATLAGNLSGSSVADGLTFAGPGTLVLAGNNSYAGPTVASSGRLVVNGTVGSGVTVNSGAVLGGTGRISGPVTVQAGGTFAPGQSPGVITVGSLSFSGAGTVAMEITGTSKSSPVQYDQIVGTSLGVTGTSTIDYTGGVLNLQMSGTYDVGTVFDLFTFPITTGTLSGVSMAGSSADWNGLTWSGPGAGQFDYGPGVWQSSWATVGGQSRKLLFDQSTGDLVVVPEPSTLVMAGAGVAGLACMRWRRRGRRSATPAEKAAQTT